MSERPQHSALDARDQLIAIADTWPDLVDRLGQGGSRVLNDRVSGSTPTGLVINETVSDVMAEVRTWAQFLARVLMEETTVTHTWVESGVEKSLTMPWAPHDGSTDDLLREIARTRIGHFTAHPDEGLREAFYDDAAKFRRKVQAVAYPSGKKRVPLHVGCLEYVTTDAGERSACTGSYEATLDPEMPGLIPDMVCNTDPTHRVTPIEWQRAARKSAYDPTAMRRFLGAIRQGA